MEKIWQTFLSKIFAISNTFGTMAKPKTFNKVSAAFLILILLPLVSVSAPLSVAAGQDEPVLLTRGLDYETWQLNSTHYQYVSAPRWVWDGNEYVPYIFEDHYRAEGYYLMRNAFITVRVFDDHAEFWNVDNNKVLVEEESWVPEIYANGWRAINKYNPSLSVVTNSSGIFITQSWTLGLVTNVENAFQVMYSLREAAPLKHLVSLSNRDIVAHEFRVVEAWNGIAANKIIYGNSETAIASTVNVYSTAFGFKQGENSVIYLDLSQTGYYDSKKYQNDVLQPATFSIDSSGMAASFTMSNRELYTLEPEGLLQIDPNIWAISLDLNGYVYHRGIYWITLYGPGDQTVYGSGNDIFIGKYDAGFDDDHDYYLYRGYVSFDTNSTIISGTPTSAHLYLYCSSIQCLNGWGTEGTGFDLELYSGKNKWNPIFSSSNDPWGTCDTYEDSKWFDNDSPTGEYEWNVDPASICRDDTDSGRTQFELKLAAGYVYDPPGFWDNYQMITFYSYYYMPKLTVTFT